MSTRDQIFNCIRATPALPASATELIPLLQDPDSEPEDICQIIAYDPGLTATVLRIANSAALGSTNPVASMREALMRLGTKRVLSAVTSAAVAPIAMKAVSGYNLRPGSLWENCVGVALATEEFATILGTTAVAETFTAGLLSDVGKLVLGEFVAREAEAIRRAAFEGGLSFDQAERDVMGVDHAEAGAALLQAWNLPESIVEVVRWHHEPEKCPEAHRAVVDLVHLADYACMLSGLGGGDDGTNYVPSLATASRLGLSTADIERGMCQTVCKLEEAREMFGLINVST